ncbi:MAG: hypothetical protein MHMPM18_001366 [Marteilia pararefringens]
MRAIGKEQLSGFVLSAAASDMIISAVISTSLFLAWQEDGVVACCAARGGQIR